MEEVIIRMVRAASHAKKFDEILVSSGYSNSPYGFIFDELSDALYGLIGETADPFEESAAFTVFHSGEIPDSEKASMLMNAYKMNRPALN